MIKIKLEANRFEVYMFLFTRGMMGCYILISEKILTLTKGGGDFDLNPILSSGCLSFLIFPSMLV